MHKHLLQLILVGHLGKDDFHGHRLDCLHGLLELRIQFHLLDGMNHPSHMNKRVLWIPDAHLIILISLPQCRLSLKDIG